MKIYYEDNLLFEDVPKEDVDKIIDSYIASIDKEYDEIYNKVLNLMEKIEKIRYRGKYEILKDYISFIEKEYPEILEELESIGKEFYKESFQGIFFSDSKCGLVGVYANNSKYCSNKIFLDKILLAIANKVPVKQLFHVTED